MQKANGIVAWGDLQFIKKGEVMKKHLYLLVILLVVFVLQGCSLFSPSFGS
jgi:hypothetical protein